MGDGQGIRTSMKRKTEEKIDISVLKEEGCESVKVSE